MTASRPTILLALGLLVVLTPAALLPIHNPDFFWHIATGRWIVEHHALPLTDPFAIASDRSEWINGEWLWEVLFYAIGSFTAMAIVSSVLVAAMFAFAFMEASRSGAWAIALFLSALAFAGGYRRFDVRPSTIAAVLLVLGVAMLDRHHDLLYLLVTILWINVHPSALLAPAVALIFRRVHWLPFASAAALLLNPFGWKGIVAPIRLTLYIRAGGFANGEWAPSDLQRYPLVYVAVLLGLIAFFLTRTQLPRFVLFALLAALAMQHLRNQGLFFAVFPMLVTPMFPAGWSRWWIAPLAVVPIGWMLLRSPHHTGFEKEMFPLQAVARLKETQLAGNIYNPDQFGGLLIWTFYPERRTLTDGRNELYHAFIPEWSDAQYDDRAWRALLARYRIDLAVDEKHPRVIVTDPATGLQRLVPAPRSYWPAKEWALIGEDEVAMAFARRAAFPPETIRRWELRPR